MKKKLPDHPIWNVPNTLPDNIAFTGTSIYTRDAMRVDWEPKKIYHAGTYSQFPDSGSIIIHDKNPNPASADNVFFTFNIAQITDQSLAKKLIQNVVAYLFNVESAPLGKISGNVTLQGAPNSGGVEVRLTGTTSKTTFTDTMMVAIHSTHYMLDLIELQRLLQLVGIHIHNRLILH